MLVAKVIAGKTWETITKFLHHLGIKDTGLEVAKEVNLIKLVKMKRDGMVNNKAIARTEGRPRENGTRGDIDRDCTGITSAILIPFLIILLGRGVMTLMSLLMGSRIGRLVGETLALIRVGGRTMRRTIGGRHAERRSSSGVSSGARRWRERSTGNISRGIARRRSVGVPRRMAKLCRTWRRGRVSRRHSRRAMEGTMRWAKGSMLCSSKWGTTKEGIRRLIYMGPRDRGIRVRRCKMCTLV
jgi:hypothetical protein